MNRLPIQKILKYLECVKVIELRYEDDTFGSEHDRVADHVVVHRFDSSLVSRFTLLVVIWFIECEARTVVPFSVYIC